MNYLCTTKQSNITIMEISIYGQHFNIELVHAYSETAGYGHKRIVVELNFNGETKEFASTTSNMSDYDKASDIEDYEDRQKALFDLIYYKVEELIYEWAS